MTWAATITFLTPTFKPVGGVVKIFDYLTHAREAGFSARVYCPDPIEPDLPLFDFDRFRGVRDDPRIEFTTDDRLGLGAEDYAFISWPKHYEIAVNGLAPGMAHERIIHIVQNVRHANPAWADGYAVRLLTRPMARIMTNEVVLEAVSQLLNRTSITQVIPLGHELGYFHLDRSGGLGDPCRVAYTTWKSSVGDLVKEELGGEGFEFRAVREHVPWSTLRELYRWADVFLCCPNPEEGFYMPGLEAMEAGAIIITPDVGGNRAYCRFGENCVLVRLDDPESYAQALRRLRAAPDIDIEQMRAEGYRATGRFTLDGERRLFHTFLEELGDRVNAIERGTLDPRQKSRSRQLEPRP